MPSDRAANGDQFVFAYFLDGVFRENRYAIVILLPIDVHLLNQFKRPFCHSTTLRFQPSGHKMRDGGRDRDRSTQSPPYVSV